MRIGFVAGETSGDQLGAGLITELRRAVPGLECEGVAGPLMQQAGCDRWESAHALAVMGLIEPLLEIPRLFRLRRSLIARWRARPPDVFVGIDAPEFNLGLEEALRRSGVPTVHYVSPSVWAWRRRRIHKIARAADRVLCLLPFEKEFYDRHGVAADFVGHPLADTLPLAPDRAAMRRKLGISAARLLAVLPGSRSSEMSRLGQPFVGACRLLRERHPELSFVAPMATPALRPVFERLVAAAGIEDCFHVLDGNATDAIAASDLALVASGTATLQAALLGRPMVVAYRLAPLTYAIARMFRLVRTAWFSLPNLLADEPLVPEFMQAAVTPANLCAAVASLLEDDERRQRIAGAFAALRRGLARGADHVAAQAVLDVARRRGQLP